MKYSKTNIQNLIESESELKTFVSGGYKRAPISEDGNLEIEYGGGGWRVFLNKKQITKFDEVGSLGVIAERYEKLYEKFSNARKAIEAEGYEYLGGSVDFPSFALYKDGKIVRDEQGKIVAKDLMF